ncbi:hypothetical protein CEXT_746221 [Caerostris extrusa]|uniref:Uncharacterized protein n=1 Tax=Caerostris extrusa TaxID=172846 RepID=A0AAV4SY35_CAEEX|nr:hypothetical protein CEXT_746221 [Caerostris extrusa]
MTRGYRMKIPFSLPKEGRGKGGRSFLILKEFRTTSVCFLTQPEVHGFPDSITRPRKGSAAWVIDRAMVIRMPSKAFVLMGKRYGRLVDVVNFRIAFVIINREFSFRGFCM